MKLKAHWARTVIASIALAFGFSGTAISRPVTFAWDSNPTWPAGTTVELEANGASANGITASQHTLDIPVQPGEVINARARAIPPSGYQCGNPLAPCPPSPWSESLAQTVPQNPSGLWATKELTGNTQMAIAYISSQVITASSGSINQSVTVPAGANYAVIYYGGWNSTARTVSAMSLGGTSASNLYTRATTNDFQDGYIYGVATSAGSKTFILTMSGSVTEGGVAMLVFLSGVDTSNPFVSSAYQEVTSTQVSTMSGSITSVADGIALSFATGYSDGGALTPTAQSQTTAVSSALYNSDLYAAGYKATTGTSTTVGMDHSGSGAALTYWAFHAVTLRPASGSTTNTSTSNIDALVQKTGITATSSLNALLQKSFSGTVSIDSIIAAIKTGSISIDALLNATNKSATVSVDGLLQAVKTGTVSIDAAIAIIVAATSGIDALLQSSFSATAGLDAIISGSSTITASLDGLLQSGKSTTALLDALLQAGYLLQTDIDAIIAKAFISTASIDALLQDMATTSTGLDAIISGGSSASVVLDALLQTGAVSTASIDALLQKSASSTASLDAFVQGSSSAVAALDGMLQGAKTGTLSLDAIIVSAGQALVTTSLDGLVQALKTGALSLDAMVAVPVAGATAGLDALLSVTGVSTVSIGALLQSAKTGIISIDGLIQSAKTAQVSIDGLVQAAKVGTTSLDSLVGIIGSSIVSLDAIIQKSRASGVFIDAIIGLISAIIMPTGRVISIAPTDRFIVISETDRFIVIPNSDRSVVN